MTYSFHTNRTTTLFFGLLSLIVAPVALFRLYGALAPSGASAFGVRSLLALVLPVLTYFSWRNGRLVVDDIGVRIGRAFYASNDHRFALRTERRSLKDRPLTSLWKRDYDVLTVSRDGAGEVHRVALEMSGESVRRLRQAIGRWDGGEGAGGA